MFAGSLKDLDTPKKMYIKNSEFVPESMCEHAEARLHNFISTIKNAKHHHQLNAKRSTNLTYLQQQHLKFLRNNQQFIILDADKNLGPCIMERDTYINLLLQEHLQNPNNTYSLLSEEDAFNNLQNTRLQFNAIFKKHEKSILPVEKLFFACTMNNPTRIPQFYGLPKIHKNKSPMPSRPVISQCGSYSAIISTYIDYKLQQLTPSIPSYIKNSASLLNKLDKLKSLPPNCKLFTSDATSMYTNIDPGEGVNTLCLYLNKYASEGKGSTLNKELVCELMKLVMENNIFQFGNSYWKQNVGTAMGTPCACIYATIFFAWFERERTMTKYKRNLILYCRQIDNIFGIWQHNREHPDWFEEFNKQDLNSYTKLVWNTKELSNLVNFLDLTISLEAKGKHITYKTFQKPMNLFLYIPGHSAHPPGVVKSLIFGLLQTYFQQNKKESDFNMIVKQLFRRLLAWGHHFKDIHPIFLEAATKIDMLRAQRLSKQR
jgi:hypothetical protein